MAAKNVAYGRRMIPAMIDEVAETDPQRPYICIPVDNADLSKGQRDVTFKEFANAVNHAVHWLRENVFRGQGAEGELETFAYAGPKDLRYLLFCMAALKLRKKVHLLKISECTTYLHADVFAPLIKPIVAQVPGVVAVEVPSPSAWVDGGEAPEYPYTRTIDEVGNDPWVLVHSSGTTGPPKLLPQSMSVMNAFDALRGVSKDVDPEAAQLLDSYSNGRIFTSLPIFRIVGMYTNFTWPVYLNAVPVIGPPGPPSAGDMMEVIRNARCNAALLTPQHIEDIIKLPGGLELLRSMKQVFFAGAPVSERVAKQLVPHVAVVPLFGSTEAGGYHLSPNVDISEQWQYMRFRPINGSELQDRGSGLYEYVVVRNPKFEQFQSVFRLFPQINEYATGDLFTRHPDPNKANLWKFEGRTSDLVKLDNGGSLFATQVEDTITQAPGVRTVLVGGEGKPSPYIVFDLHGNDGAANAKSLEEKKARIDALWPYVESANNQLSELARVPRENIVLADPDRPLPGTLKGMVSRKPATELYKAEIESLYAA